MPKSKARKKTKKKKTQRLVMDFCSREGTRYLAQQYMSKRLKWFGKMLVEHTEGDINEYAVHPDKEILLDEFIATIRRNISQFVEDDSVWFGFKVYLRI